MKSMARFVADTLRGPPVPPTLPGYRQARSRRRQVFRYVLGMGTLALVSALFGFFFALFPPSFYLYLAAPIAVAVLVAIWALPETEKPLPAMVSFFFFAFLISLCVWPNYLALALPGLPWITSNRLFTVPLFFAFLVSLSVSSDFKRRVAEPLAHSRPAMIALIIFVGLQFLTIAFSWNPARSATLFVNAQLEFTMIILVSLWIFSFEKNARLFAPLCLFFGLYQAGLGLGEYVSQSVFWADAVPEILKGDKFLVSKILSGQVRYAVGTHRSQGTFTTSLSYAEFLGIVQPFMLYIVFFWKNIFVKVLGGLAFILALIAIILSQSRLGLVATIVGLLLFSLILALRYWRIHRNSLLSPAIILAYPIAAAGFLALTVVWNRLSNMVWGGGETQASNVSRMEQYQTGFQKVLDWPFGYGMGNAAKQIGMVSADGMLNIDTYYMLILLDNGIIGFISYATIFIYAIYKTSVLSVNNIGSSAYHTIIIPISCALTSFFITKSVLSQEDTHSFIAVILGLAISAIYMDRHGSSAEKAR
ncbi:MAG: hypothetical protein ABS87_02325 [Sphingomonas sp. SCN 67-18]|nr:MAG: hypothetical protein ABS87_02325 [Sphingomonas sp. SCN 67-18]